MAPSVESLKYSGPEQDACPEQHRPDRHYPKAPLASHLVVRFIFLEPSLPNSFVDLGTFLITHTRSHLTEYSSL